MRITPFLKILDSHRTSGCVIGHCRDLAGTPQKDTTINLAQAEDINHQSFDLVPSHHGAYSPFAPISYHKTKPSFREISVFTRPPCRQLLPNPANTFRFTTLKLNCSITPTSRLMTTTTTSTPAEQKPPFPPFTTETAVQKVRMAEDGWNTRNPDRVKMAYTVDSEWRNRDTFLRGHDEITRFLTTKWQKETNYRLIKELWAVSDNRIAVRFAYEFQDVLTGDWFRAYGNENWEFDRVGLMQKRYASINNVAIAEADRKFHWPQQAPRPVDHPSLTELGL
jgi:hypothetical protein